MLENTTRLIIGSSIANIYARDAFTARRGLRTLSSLYDDRFILGLGVSHVPMVEGVRGHVYDKPVPAMRRYLDGVYGDRSNAAEWPLVIAALGPLMLKLAAERTAGAVPYNVTPEHTRAARAALGPDKLLAVEQKVCLQSEATAARALARRELHRYMALTNYRNNWRRLGFMEADLADGGSDRFIDAMVLWGRLDGKWHVAGARVRQDRGEAVGHHTARSSDVPRAGRQAADYQHKALRPEGRGFVYRALVVVNCRLPSGSIRGGEHAAAAVAGDAHAIRFDDAHGFREPKRRHLVAPRIDFRDAVTRARLYRLAQVPLLADGSQIDRK